VPAQKIVEPRPAYGKNWAKRYVSGGDIGGWSYGENWIERSGKEAGESGADVAGGQAQATLRKRILRAFVGRGLLESFQAQEMLGYQHSGFSVDTGVCIQAHDSAALERLLRYFARAHPLPWIDCAKRALPWCTAVPNNIASQALTNALPRWTSFTSRRWS
jgi:Putative transposase